MQLGTGVNKGPVTGQKVRRGWKQPAKRDMDGREIRDEFDRIVSESSDYQLDIAYGERPAYLNVDLFSYFPDPDVSDVKNGNGDFERHLFSPSQVRGLQHLQGFDKNALRRILMTKENTAPPSYIADLRNIRGSTTQVMGDVYHVWEYNGPLEPEEMQALALHMGNEDAYNSIERTDEGDIDPLQEIYACVWFCNGQPLKFEVYPMDSGETMYSVFCFRKDISSIFGFGMPRLIRDPQAAINGAWRTQMDNAGISSGPMVVINQSAVAPADGDWTFRPRKVWLAAEGWQKENPPVQLLTIVNNQAELANIAVMGERYLDIMSTMPAIGQGEQGSEVTKTFQGMAILVNNMNVMLRGPVKCFDDDVTVPDIRRCYDWLMQDPKTNPAIKGDYEVKARGSSVLLVRELQSQQLMNIAIQFGAHPIYGPMLKNRELLREIFKAHNIPASKVMLSDEQIDIVLARAAKAAEEAAQAQSSEAAKLEVAEMTLTLGRERIEADVNIANQNNDTKMKMAKFERDTQMFIFASKANVTLEQLNAMLEKQDMVNQQKDRALAVESAFAAAQPSKPTGGAV